MSENLLSVPVLFGTSKDVRKGAVTKEIHDAFDQKDLNNLLLTLDDLVPDKFAKVGKKMVAAHVYPMVLGEDKEYEFAVWRQEIELEGEIHYILAIAFAEEARLAVNQELN
jgi:hypothetical protein